MRRLLSMLVALSIVLAFVPSFADSYSDMMDKAAVFLAAGDNSKAKASYKLAQKIDASRIDAFLAEAAILFDETLYDESEAVLETVFSIDPVSGDAWLLKCRIDVARNDAVAFDEDAVFAEVCDVDLVPYAAVIAEMYFKAGNAEKAAKYFDQAEFLSDEQKSIYHRALIFLGKKDEANAKGLSSSSYRDEKLDVAFESDNLILKQTSTPILKEIEFTEKFWDSIGITPNSKECREYQSAVFEAEQSLLSISPSGNSAIFRVGRVCVALYNGECHVMYPSSTRGVKDVNRRLADFIYLLSYETNFFIGCNGVSYSHDGKYASICNFQALNLLGDISPCESIIIDLSTGELILTETHGRKAKNPDFGVVTTSCFSRDDRYYYYMLRCNSDPDTIVGKLYRYDLLNQTTEFCVTVPYNNTLPQLCELENGSLLLLEEPKLKGISEDTVTGVVEITSSNNQWEVKLHEFSLPYLDWCPCHLRYSENSGYAICGGYTWPRSVNGALMIFRPDAGFDGFNNYWIIDSESKNIFNPELNSLMKMIDECIDPESGRFMKEKTSYEEILYGVLSPDGYYAMLLTSDKNGSAHLWLLSLEKMVCKEIHGIDPEKISIQVYDQWIEWSNDVLIFRIDSKTVPYQFSFDE